MPAQIDDRDRAVDDYIRKALEENERRRSIELVETVVGGLFNAIIDSAKQ